MSNSDTPQPGDIYEAKHGQGHYVLKSGLYSTNGKCLAEYVDQYGRGHAVTIDPTSPPYVKRVNRPPFPGQWSGIGMAADGSFGVILTDSVAFIGRVDVAGLPWRWPDGTLVTDAEKGIDR